MNRIKRSFSFHFKAQVALDMISETDTVARICSKHGIHPTQAGKWKAAALAGLPTVFENPSSFVIAEKEALIDRLYQEVGQMKVELDWLKKKTRSS